MSGALAGIEDETLPNGSLHREAHPVDKKSIFGAGELNNRRSLARGHGTGPIGCGERPAKQRDVRIDGAGHLPEESQRYYPSQVYRRLSAPECLSPTLNACATSRSSGNSFA